MEQNLIGIHKSTSKDRTPTFEILGTLPDSNHVTGKTIFWNLFGHKPMQRKPLPRIAKPSRPLRWGKRAIRE